MPTDPTIAGCLEKIRRGDVTAVGVLADYLEENRLPKAKSVRNFWVKYGEYIRRVEEMNIDRRRLSKWEMIAQCRSWLRRRICNLYGRKWNRIDPKRYVS
jgi:hypothetical protein